jgi:hypothetical protein
MMLRNVKLLPFAVFVALMASACTTKLGPKYDAVLFDGVTGVNVSIMTLFASVSDGSTSDGCAQRKENIM